jgi:uncharacterized protein YjbI with pentapeptide repeats
VLNYFFGFALLINASPASASIYQWFDGDNNGSLWLSNSVAEPYSDLSSEILWWANLENATLHHSHFVFSDLSFANLYEANLSSSDLSYSNLFNSNLENADLSFTNFNGADLQFSNMGNANMFYANFINANLSNVQNWDLSFWLAAKYNANTAFPDGMNPVDYGMLYLEVPSPAVIPTFAMLFWLQRRRR